VVNIPGFITSDKSRECGECGEMGRWGDGEMGRWGDGGVTNHLNGSSHTSYTPHPMSEKFGYSPSTSDISLVTNFFNSIRFL
jgi:hypothetical protein